MENVKQEFGEDLIAKIRIQSPLIHCITNYVTANDVANMILAIGASPVMADGEKEVEDIASICSALVINMGTLKEAAIPAMIKAGKRAASIGRPVVFDPVGAGASAFRTESGRRIMEEVPCSLIRGNVSEIKALSLAPGQEKGRTKGVDASGKDRISDENLEEHIQFAKTFARTHRVTVLMTGTIDVVTDGNKTFLIRNGTPLMKRITGAGCMLDGLSASFLAVAEKENYPEAAALAAAAEGYCGELAEKKVTEEKSGTGSFRMHLIDAVSGLDDNQLKEGLNIEIR